MACQHCGQCCSYVALELRPDTALWVQLHGIPTAEEKGRHWLVLKDAPCKWRDEETSRCLHYSDRPAACREFLCPKAQE